MGRKSAASTTPPPALAGDLPPREATGGRARATRARSISAETNDAIAAASHLTPMDMGAVAVLRQLAKTLDKLLKTGFVTESGKFDNVSMPTYLRYCESLGLTPAGRRQIAPKEPPSAPSKLGQLRAVHGGKA
ncbi:hypothetical protein ACFWPK_04375 [Nocardia sp. NPDC058519]|uniref:terminase small subunit n=1 Tax=Nocardia sp. NPDC058519 TaxID=3346535 RepID=UPI00364F78C3